MAKIDINKLALYSTLSNLIKLTEKLNQVGIETPDTLVNIGAEEAFEELKSLIRYKVTIKLFGGG